jgi:hypothetical protein
MRQGPHHSAQKSTTTGLSLLRASSSKLLSVNSSAMSQLVGIGGCPRVGFCSFGVQGKDVLT